MSFCSLREARSITEIIELGRDTQWPEIMRKRRPAEKTCPNPQTTKLHFLFFLFCTFALLNWQLWKDGVEERGRSFFWATTRTRTNAYICREAKIVLDIRTSTSVFGQWADFLQEDEISAVDIRYPQRLWRSVISVSVCKMSVLVCSEIRSFSRK